MKQQYGHRKPRSNGKSWMKCFALTSILLGILLVAWMFSRMSRQSSITESPENNFVGLRRNARSTAEKKANVKAGKGASAESHDKAMEWLNKVAASKHYINQEGGRLDLTVLLQESKHELFCLDLKVSLCFGHQMSC